MMGFDGYGGMFGFGWLGMLFWTALIILGIWAAASFLPGRQQPGSETALDILKRRYARGEITATEYEQMRKDLS